VGQSGGVWDKEGRMEWGMGIDYKKVRGKVGGFYLSGEEGYYLNGGGGSRVYGVGIKRVG